MNKLQSLTATLLLFSLAAIAPATASDWPQWRGPHRDGVSSETGLLKDWPAGGPPLVWEATGLGSGFATVSVVDERIYTAGEKEASSFVFALNVADGKQVWSAKLGKPAAPAGVVGPRAAPTVDGNLLFVVEQTGELLCLETGSGTEKWRKSFTKDFGGGQPNWGFTESPLVDGDQVAVTPGGAKGAVVALNKQTGALLWQSTGFTDPAHYSSLILAEIGGVKQYVVLTPSSVAGIAAADGKLLWRAPRRGQTAVIPTPIWTGDFVYVTSGYGAGCNLFKLSANSGSFTAQEVYANKVIVNHHGGAIKVGDYVYGYSDGKGWTCQTFLTGEAKWQNKEKLGKGGLVYADGHFYLRQEDGPGTVALIEATPDGYKEHGRFNQPHRSKEHSWPHPVIANGKLYLRDQDVLLCYDVKAR
ncbi:MAG TPA: PQQ-binding-like beta-propeller repeat protein [Candidatus Binatia bacterium]|jgi:outer membrane protein assembly factor BamB|nr:PQQ-binding-like beta-propeller repeat protein [Candidatus Binatia bacterium]